MRIGPIAIGESRGDVSSALTTVREQLRQAEGNEELLQERLAELELGLEDIGWMRFSLYAAEREFSRTGLDRLIRLCRLLFLKNPLINRAVTVTAFYVWGMGIAIKARNEQVDTVVQKFLDDPKNMAELTAHQARIAKEVDLQTAGNLFFVFFTNASTGRVRIRTIDMDEIRDIVTNPDDAKEPWLYLRSWTARAQPGLSDFMYQTDVAGDQQAYYPDWRYQPAQKPDSVGNVPIRWDSPVFHVKAGGLAFMRFGVPEVYSALDWARAAQSDLEDYATVKRAQARFAMRLTTTGGRNGIKSAKTKLQTTLAGSSSLNAETNPPPLVGSTFIGTRDGTTMEPINLRGTSPNPEDGRRLWLMVASGVGLPETFFGDADVGNHATSKTLDRPTELRMKDRQTLWVHVLTSVLDYVVLQAVKAVNGPLHGLGTIAVDEDDRSETVVWNEDIDAETTEGEDQPLIDGSVDVKFPDILEHDVAARVNAIVQAATLGGFQNAGTFDDETLIRELYQALGVELSEDNLHHLLVPDDAADDVSYLPQNWVRRRAALAKDMSDGIVSKGTVATKLGYDAAEPAAAADEKNQAEQNLGEHLLRGFEKGAD